MKVRHLHGWEERTGYSCQMGKDCMAPVVVAICSTVRGVETHSSYLCLEHAEELYVALAALVRDEMREQSGESR